MRELDVLPIILNGFVSSTGGEHDAPACGGARELGHQPGRPLELVGRVEHGDKRGRTIGFPTANLEIPNSLSAFHGVYAVHAGLVQGIDTVWHKGVANIGDRPTFDGSAARLEVHLFDFAGDLYGQELRVQLIGFIRQERKFASVDELKEQIVKDVIHAKSILSD